MKNIIVMLAVVAGISACASNQPEPQVAPATVAPAPVAPAPVAPARPRHACGVKAPVQAPVQQGCNTCGPRSYTVSEPVEVLYKNVTYTTVYEPKTYSETTYVKKPYTCPNGGLCGQKAPEPMPVEVRK